MSASHDETRKLLYSIQTGMYDVRDRAVAIMPNQNDTKTEHMFATYEKTKHQHHIPTSNKMFNAYIPSKQAFTKCWLTLDCHHTTDDDFSNIT